jgi:hypothetical protein
VADLVTSHEAIFAPRSGRRAAIKERWLSGR